jgi:hypothetical protein
MVVVKYPGVLDPRRAFEALRPFRRAIGVMQDRCRPFGSDYLILSAVVKALDTAAYHFTREPDFFNLRPEQSNYQPPADP